MVVKLLCGGAVDALILLGMFYASKPAVVVPVPVLVVVAFQHVLFRSLVLPNHLYLYFDVILFLYFLT
ncbi:hypothetical protein, partial [Acinetobacter baumannii]|uniref:hypothetical protein n=1 Tax=Acinetobacter baumannii TaxID=470 RepID=UPI0022779EC2